MVMTKQPIKKTLVARAGPAITGKFRLPIIDADNKLKSQMKEACLTTRDRVT